MAVPVLFPSLSLPTDTLRSSLCFPAVSAVRGRTIQCMRQDRNPIFGGAVASPLISSRRGKIVLWHRLCEMKRRRALTASSKIAQQTSTFEVFEGLDDSDTPVKVCETRGLPPAISLEEAMVTLHSAISNLDTGSLPSESGSLRFQAPLPSGLKALQWLQSQPEIPVLQPRSYFSPREARGTGTDEMTSESFKQFSKLDVSRVGAVAGVGAAVLFSGSESFSLNDWKSIRRFLSKRYPMMRAYGAMRFDPKLEPSKEWRPFGSFYFFIPQIEFCECDGCSLLAVTLTWDKALRWPLMKALKNALTVMRMVSTRICPDNERPLARVLAREHNPSEQSWHDAVNRTTASLNNQRVECTDYAKQLVHDQSASLSKVVMARRTKLEMNGVLDPISLLACLQDKDPSAYQIAIQATGESTFIGSSPERLFVRDGLLVSSEAVAGTRARGSTPLKDQQLGTELMQSTKDTFEFELVRESIKRSMEAVCKSVTVDCPKSLLKQARVQHLYARLNGELHNDDGEFDLLSALHPTPAVCGLPQDVAREEISKTEAFDRGLYAGPAGWFGGDGAEFAVGIRSSLIQQCTSNAHQNGAALSNGSMLGDTFCLRKEAATFNHSKLLVNGEQETSEGTSIFLYAGVGVVKDSNPASEWRELELKISQFEALLEQRQTLETIANVNDCERKQ